MSVDDITERVVIEQTLLKVHETFVYKVRSKILRSKQSISHYKFAHVLSNFLLKGSAHGNQWGIPVSSSIKI